jgi:hypothetical protein
MGDPYKGRLSGHSLLFEGQPCGLNFYARSGNGSGKCSCGELSPILPTNAARKRWHREHKADVLDSWVAQGCDDKGREIHL